MTTATPDRRAALKQRHRQAIVAAAAALMDETRGMHFTVDELAARADVSRRTVFNHFASIDDIVMAVCSDVLGALVDNLVVGALVVPVQDDAVASMFEEVAHTLRVTDMVTPMSYLTRSLGPMDEDSPWRAALLLRSFALVGERFSAAMATRHPDVDALELELLVSAFMSGLTVLHQHWFAATGAADDEPSRQVWAGLVERLLVILRHGYASPGPSGAL